MLTTFDDDDIRRGGAEPRRRRVHAEGHPPERPDRIPPRGLQGLHHHFPPGGATSSCASARGKGKTDEAAEPRARPVPEGSFLRYLSKREIEILRLIGKGADNALIARKLCIAEQTVKNHVSVIYSKLHVHNRMQAMMLANSLKDYFELE